MTLFDDLPETQPDVPLGAEFVAPDFVAPEVALSRVKLTVAYDGSPFHGFAANPGVITVAGELTEAIERVLRHPVTLTCAGRTDKGVHAHGQVISFDAPTEGLDPKKLQHAVNGLCGPRIVIRTAVVVDSNFDARFSARSRLYRYTVLNSPLPDPFLAQTTWWVSQPLDLRAMRLAADPLIGEHDFSSFCRRPKDPQGAEKSLVRRVIDAHWNEVEVDVVEDLDKVEDLDEVGLHVLRFEIEATAFCHQMVRSITGTLVDVGLGRLRAGDVSGILRARDRSAAGTVAPPHGLCLYRVNY